MNIKKFLQIVVYVNQFSPILTPRRPKFSKQIQMFLFPQGNRQTIKNYLKFCKLTQIPVISRVLELNYHKNSQRYPKRENKRPPRISGPPS